MRASLSERQLKALGELDMEKERRIAELEAERDDLRQRLIGGVELCRRDNGARGKWATVNDAYLMQPKT